MRRLALRALNGPLFILLALVATGLQTSLFQGPPLIYFEPDLLLIWVIWCALKRPFTEGGILVLILGEIAETHSSAPKGLFLTSYMAVFLATRGASRFIVLPRLSTLASYTAITSGAHTLIMGLILAMLGLQSSFLRQMLYLILPTACATGALSFWIYRWLKQFDWYTYKDPMAQQALESELYLEEEGL